MGKIAIDTLGYEMKNATNHRDIDPRGLVINWGENMPRDGEVFDPNEENMRGLIESLMEHGQLQDCVVIVENSRYKLVWGYRRAFAALHIVNSGLNENFKLGVEVAEKMNTTDIMIRSLVENLERKDPEPIQTAKLLRHLKENVRMSVEEIAKKASRTVNWVYKQLELCSLELPIQQAVQNGETTVSAVADLASLPPSMQLSIFSSVKKDTKPDDNGKIRIRAGAVKAKVREVSQQTGAGKKSPHSMTDVKAFLESMTGTAETPKCRRLASMVLNWIADEISDKEVEQAWTECTE